MLYNLLGGGLMLGAFFMATDYVTSPVTEQGPDRSSASAAVCSPCSSAISAAITEGVCYSILVMNLHRLAHRQVHAARPLRRREG